MQRRIAFCVDRWSADSTLFSWTFAKQFFLRKQREGDKETLNELDKLFVVHVGKSKGEPWDAGGPILPRLSTALENYPHTIVELEGRDVANALVDYAAKERMDVMIIGSRDNKNAAQKMLPGTTVGSVSETMKARAKVPCLIVRPASARNERMRIKSMRNLADIVSQPAPGHSLPQPLKASMLSAQASAEPRRVCIAFEHTDSGNNMVTWAARHCLFPDDDVHLVHCTNRGALEKMQKSASFQRAMLKPRQSKDFEDAHADSVNLDDIGKDELQNFEEPLRVRLKGDAKSELTEYVHDRQVDLLIVGFSAASRMKKALTGGSLSTHLLQHGSCPVLVIPLKAMAWEEDSLPQVLEIRPPSTGLEGSGPLGDEAVSPNHSLGPRVSISRSLSHQLSQASKEGGVGAFLNRRNTSGALPPAGAAQPRSSSAPPEDLEGQGSASQSFQPDFEAVKQMSPFAPVAHHPRESTDSVQLLGAREARASHESRSSQDVALLQQQLREKSAHIRILEDELKQMRLQVAAMKGSSREGRVSFNG